MDRERGMDRIIKRGIVTFMLRLKTAGGYVLRPVENE